MCLFLDYENHAPDPVYYRNDNVLEGAHDYKLMCS